MINMKFRVTISIDKEVSDKIDKQRGDVARSRFLNTLLTEYLKGGRKHE